MAVGSGINLKESDPADIPTPDTGKVTIFIDSTNSDEPSYKDDTGTVHTLVGTPGATGATGPMGPAGVLFLEPDQGEDIMPIPGPPGANGSSGGGSWSLIENRVLSASAEEDFINLSGYSEIQVWCVAVVKAVSGTLNLRVSTDNGSTFLTASGDYQTISGLGVATNVNTMPLHATNATAARTCRGQLYGFNTASAPKWGFTSASNTEVFLPGTTALNAIRIFNPAGGNLTAGNIYVFGRQ